MKKIICDRCRKDISQEYGSGEPYSIFVRNGNGAEFSVGFAKQGKGMDLCNGCMSEVLTFLGSQGLGIAFPD